MFRKRMSVFAVLITCMMLVSAAGAQQKKLAVGDAAPGLDIESWVSGSETSIQNGTAYVVMFFQSTSAPARRGMSVINDGYKDFHDAGLEVIAISWEEPDVVKRFVAGMRETLSITIAADRREGTRRRFEHGGTAPRRILPPGPARAAPTRHQPVARRRRHQRRACQTQRCANDSPGAVGNNRGKRRKSPRFPPRRMRPTSRFQTALASPRCTRRNVSAGIPAGGDVRI